MSDFYALPVVMPTGTGDGGYAYNGLRGLGEDAPQSYSALVRALDESGFVVKGIFAGGLLGLVYVAMQDRPVAGSDALTMALPALAGIAGGMVAKAVYKPLGA